MDRPDDGPGARACPGRVTGILLALFAFEAAFGLAGMAVAPIVDTYARHELVDRGLV